MRRDSSLADDYVEGILEKRTPHRPQHLELAKSKHNEGVLLMAGAYGDATGACFVFDCDSEDTIKEFVNADPYVQNGLVPNFEIKEWTTVDLK
mmetsp:Transcript_26250/g.42515  ORF Transcript_26250/g.42515 Transcript_26250/m.42515 type:complete len:93 (-) Transcript_26250:906-1184(-)